MTINAVCRGAMYRLSAMCICYKLIEFELTGSLSVLALQAVNIALFTIDTVSGGALEKAGADILEFLQKRFQGRLRVDKSESKLLEAAILSEAELDKKFQEDLERLVTQYQQIQSRSYVSQATESGVNVSVDKNSGTVVGQQIEQKFFR
jgi:hypothetical protein